MSMTKREKVVFDNLFDVTQDIEKTGNSRHAAAVIKKGAVYGLGVNSSKTDPMQRQYSDHPLKVCIHAEVAAIKRASSHLRTRDLSNCTLMVVRSKSDDDGNILLGNSKPCDACQKAIDEHGIRKVIYSIDNGYKVEKTYRSNK